MAANTAPIYTLLGDVSSNGTTGFATHLVTATADYTGAAATNLAVFTANATNGSYIQKLKFVAEGTNTASVARIYINNGTDHTTATNNTLVGMVSLPGTTAIDTAAIQEVEYPMNMALNPGFVVYVGLGTTVAAGWRCTAVGGRY